MEQRYLILRITALSVLRSKPEHRSKRRAAGACPRHPGMCRTVPGPPAPDAWISTTCRRSGQLIACRRHH
ncbi:hypothetical protein ADK64_31660 [Streptomyces sp. MMG1121]|nr:hypothetical protein ADK64_31660 [Streptomyces sp. MMG1121]